MRLRNRRRLARTAGRATSAGRRLFFDDVIVPMQRTFHRRDVHAPPPAPRAVVRGRQLTRRRIPEGHQQGLEVRGV